MAKVLRTIAVVAGAVALIATGIGAVGGAAFAASALGGTIATVAQIAGVVAGVAGIGAQLLTKPPPARGSVTETIIDVNPPSPYGMGEGYFGGVLRHKVGYGPTLKKVPNPFLFEAVALCVAGPIAGPIVPQVDFGPVTSYYSGWLATDTRLGQRPDTALTAPLQANPTGWSSSHRLSSVAAIAWNHRFDKDGKIYASGLPTRGVVAKWALCYDPRKDSTRPGGSGSHRLGIETTYEWSENPALHAGTYAYGRFVNGKRVIGVGLPDEGIDWEGVAAWANDCQANGWRMFGFVFEGAADDAQRRWQNLRDICIAGGGEPLFSGAVLGFHWHRPRVPLDTVTEADLAEGPQEVTAMKSWRDRLNTVRPRYTSPAHNWSLVQAAQVQVASYLAEDGEERAEDIPFNFVKDVNQAAQLAAYWLTNSRELSPITLTLMPRLRNYRPGECLRLQLPELGLDHDAVILRREFDPGSMTVTLTLVTEDPAKHAFALGRTGTAPPTPSLTNSAEDRDTITREARAPYWPEVDGPGRPEDGATNTAPANANRVPFSRIEGGRGWSSFLGTVASITPIFPNVVDGRRYIVANATASAAEQIASIAGTDLFPVQPGERLSVSLNLNVFEIAGPAPAFWQVIIDYFLGDTAVSAPVVFSGTGNIGGDALREGFVTVPSGVTRARLVLLAQSGGAGTFQLNILHPMVTSAAAGQTVHPPFSPGPNASDGADPNSLITVDGSGVLSGIGTVGIPVDNRNVPLGNANRVPFSRFEGGQGWFTVGDFNPPTFLIVSNARYFICAEPTFTAANQNVFLANTPRMPVLAGETLSISAAVQAFALPGGLNPNYWHLYWEYYSSLNAGTQIGITTIGQGFTGISEGVRHAAFSTVPAGAQAAQLVLRYESAGAGQVRLAILEPMVTSAAPGQAVHPPYTPGPNSVDGATRNTGALNADGLDSIDAGGPLFVGLLPPSKAEAGLINANVALGSNAVVNSDFTRGKFGWRWGGGGFEDQWGTNLPGWFGQRNVMWARVSGAFAHGSARDLSPDALWEGGTLANAPLFALAVNDADRLFAGVLAASHRCAFQLWILVFDGAGTLIQFEEAIGGLPGGAANGDPANFSRITRFSDVPTGGRWAIPMMRMLGNGENDPFIFFTEPMLAKVPSGQTGIPRYTPGRADSRGQPNSDILISGGVISGIGTANIFVDNARAVLQSLASARPAAGEYLNQVHFATDTLVASQWDGFNWRSSADITFAVSGPAEVVLDYDSTGAIVTPLPTSTSYLLTPAGGVALTSGVSWSVAVVSGTFSGAAPSISGAGTGVLQINSGLTSNEAVLRITGTVAGRSYPPMTVRVTKRTAAPAGGGGGFASTTSFNAVSTSSFAALTGNLNVVLPSGSTSVALTAASLGVSLAAALPLGSTTLEIKWQRESSPGVWSDVGAAATSSPSPFVQTEGGGIYSVDPGSITCNRTATGLTGGSTQKFRLVGRVSAGNVRSVFTTGTASAQA